MSTFIAASDPREEAAEETSIYTLYPAPLSSEQRRLLQRHLNFLVNRYRAIHSLFVVVEKGYLACSRLLQRLESEKTTLESELEALKNGEMSTSVSTVVNAKPIARTAPREAEKRVREDEGKEQQGDTPAPEGPAPRRRLKINNSMFAHLKNTLQAANQQLKDNEGVMAARERISRETALKTVMADLAVQRANLEPLQEKYNTFLATHTEVADRLRRLLPLCNKVNEMETLYASSFTLHAYGSSTTLVPYGPMRQLVEHRQSYAIPYCPTTLTDTLESKLRSQVESVLEAYTSFRAEVDPVLKEIEQEAAERQKKRLERLKEAVGLSDTNAIDWREDVNEKATTGEKQGKKDPMGISSSSDEDEGEKEEDEKQKILNALSALDDFEEE
ncbi:hypothetical protein ADEAN_000522700 [Angomonas deanei]|uniref:Uncharacterized protein n=1 Tax=Angomonas deanei TaxID=59799 RepID=A0A7G2CFE8_9TRYP|nr:hypothetical protein ADEAN_000522700 [Angomonas deanei]